MEIQPEDSLFFTCSKCGLEHQTYIWPVEGKPSWIRFQVCKMMCRCGAVLLETASNRNTQKANKLLQQILDYGIINCPWS